MSEEFFERLQRLITNRFEPQASASYGDGYFVGMTAAIKALKEMMVGEPMKAEVQHGTSHGLAFTEIVVEEGEEDETGYLIFNGHHGTDGEEVTVFVVRDG